MHKKKEIFIVQDTNIEKHKRGRINRIYLYENQTSNKRILNKKIIYGTNVHVKKRGFTVCYDSMDKARIVVYVMFVIEQIKDEINHLSKEAFIYGK